MKNAPRDRNWIAVATLVRSNAASKRKVRITVAICPALIEYNQTYAAAAAVVMVSVRIPRLASESSCHCNVTNRRCSGFIAIFGDHVHAFGEKFCFWLMLSTSFSYQFLHFRLTHHFFLFWFTNLLTHYSVSLSCARNITLNFTPGWKPTCFTNPTPVVSLLLPNCLSVRNRLPWQRFLSYLENVRLIMPTHACIS